MSKQKSGSTNGKDNNYAIDFSKMSHGDTEVENELLKILKDASGNNKILEAKEFEEWCKKNFSSLSSWFALIKKNQNKILQQQGLITNETIKKKKFLCGYEDMPVKFVSHELRDEAIRLKGLKKFLLDFSSLPERQYFEVHLWEEYLIFAELLGISDKVEEQFSKLYPNFEQLTTLNSNIATISIRNMAKSGFKGYSAGYTSVTGGKLTSHGGSIMSSGGGGRSFSGGGGSAGGSSGGGFR